jgi:hypothetical protein
MNLQLHHQTIKVKKIVQQSIPLCDRGQVRISEPKQRQLEAFISVENFNSLCVTELVRKLPSECRVYSTAITRLPGDVVLSRVVIYYSTVDKLWKIRNLIMFVIWIFGPVCMAFTALFYTSN